MKKIYKYLIIIVVLIMILTSIVTARYEIAGRKTFLVGTNKFKVSKGDVLKDREEIVITDIANTDKKYPLDKIYKVEDEKVDLFSLSYVEQPLKIGDKLIKKDESEEGGKSYASDQLTLIFRRTYPTISLEEMGVNTVEEAYQIKQLAIWELAFRTGESMYGSELSYIDSVKNDLNLKDDTIFRKAKDLINYIENVDTEKDDINFAPTLVSNTKGVKPDYTYDNGKYIIGPYKYDIESSEIESCNIYATDVNGNDIGAEIIKGNGEIITNFKNVNEFYVSCPNSKDDITININVTVRNMLPHIYMYNDVDYIVNTYVMNTMEKKLTINWI